MHEVDERCLDMGYEEYSDSPIVCVCTLKRRREGWDGRFGRWTRGSDDGCVIVVCVWF